VTRIEHAGIAAAVTVAPLTAGLLLLAAFVAWERRAPAPLLPSGVLRVRSLRTASLGVGLNAVAFIAIVYVGTLYLQGPLGYSPLEAGAALLPVDVVAFLVSLMVAGAIARRSPRRLLIGAFTVTALALLWLARAPVPAHYATDVLAPLAALGASISVAYVVLTHEAVAEVDGDDKGVASGVFETANHLFGGAIGVAIYATVLTAAASTPTDAGGHRAAFLAATVLAALGLVVAMQAHGFARSPGPANVTPCPTKSPS
jgi:predicted small integral membrane protein